MADEDLVVTQADVESLAEKLDAFAPSLSTNEREILSWVIRRAAADAGDEVVGFAASSYNSPLSATISRGIEMGPAGAILPGMGPGGIPDLNPGKLRGKTSPNKPGFG
jgi:hypothetical protein